MRLVSSVDRALPCAASRTNGHAAGVTDTLQTGAYIFFEGRCRTSLRREA
jgi:hypothetical protein